jgi:hypothetical protein
MKNNFLSLIILILFANLATAQTANKASKPVYQKVYWFATGIEQRGSDLLLDNPGVVSEIITLECDLPNAYQIGTEFEEYFIANYAKDQGVTDVFVYPFLFGTLEEAQAKRKDIIDKTQASENTKICWVKEFKYQCN